MCLYQEPKAADGTCDSVCQGGKAAAPLGALDDGVLHALLSAQVLQAPSRSMQQVLPPCCMRRCCTVQMLCMRRGSMAADGTCDSVSQGRKAAGRLRALDDGVLHALPGAQVLRVRSCSVQQVGALHQLRPQGVILRSQA